MEDGTRMKSLEENLKRLNALVQKQVEINEQWVNSTNRSLNYTDLGLNPSTVPISIHLKSSLGGDSTRLEQWRVETASVEPFYELSPKFTQDSVTVRDDANSKVQIPTPAMEVCEVLPSSEIGIGNVEFLESDGMKCGGSVRDCEKPEFHALGVGLGSWNLELHPQVVDGNVGSKQFDIAVLEVVLVNAHELFEKMSKRDVVDLDDFVELPSILGDSYGSSSFVFDPGKRNVFPLHIEEVETIFVFDPGGLDFQCLQIFVSTNGIYMM